MGCYMSKPDDKVYVTEGKGAYFTYATASCQGWRREQEDAEDCVPYFDENASLFVLCDGHGGAEVAKYTVKHLPDFIKNHQLYKEGKYKEALEQAFIDFDALLRKDDTLEELNKMSMENDANECDEENKDAKTLNLADGLEIQAASSSDCAGPSGSSGPSCSSGNNGDSSIVEDVDTDTLRREAQVPLSLLIDQYTGGMKHVRGLAGGKFNASPVVKAKRDDEEEDDDQPSTSTSDNPGGSSSEAGSSKGLLTKEAILKQVLQRYFPIDESSEDDSEFDGENSSNGDGDGDDEDDENAGEGSDKKHRRMKHKRSSMTDQVGSSSEDDSDDDCDSSEDSEDDEDDEEDEDEEDEDDEEEDEQEDEEVDDEDGNDSEEGYDSRRSPLLGEELDENIMKKMKEKKDLQALEPASRTHRPGYDSGCTVVVALIKDGQLYVASAGDSRCIMIMRDGFCKPMSFDHKPEDTIERRRIMRAGGRVSDGRVNGGLNLSRAFGDFTYKAKLMSAKKQMITPCPDVEVTKLDPADVEYIFLACDGIWNSKKNITTSRFIRNVAPTVNNNLVDICVKLFRDCIAGTTDGDGTGCDNMTCIIVKFDDPKTTTSKGPDSIDLNVKEDTTPNQAEPSTTSSSSCKRSTNDETNELPLKRRCVRL